VKGADGLRYRKTDDVGATKDLTRCMSKSSDDDDAEKSERRRIAQPGLVRTPFYESPQ